MATEGKSRTGGLWVPALDGVRGYLSISIALAHVMLATGWTPQHELPHAFRASTFLAIDFLFLISGFVAFLPVVATRSFPGFRTYAIRRAGRVLPLYYLTILVAVVLGGLLRPVSGTDFPHDVGAVLVHLGFLQHEVYPFREGFGIQGIVWTMSVAIIFYAVFGMVATRWLRHPFLWLLGSAVLAIVWREWWRSNPQVFLQFPLFALDFGLGMTGAYVYVQLHRGGLAALRRHAAVACLLATGALVCCLYLCGLPVARKTGFFWGESSVLAVLAPLSFTALLITLPFTPRAVQAVVGNPVGRWVGSVSYGLFLFHFIVIWLVLYFTDLPRDGSPSSTLLLGALVLPISITLGWAGTRWVEHPLRMRAQRLAAHLDRRSAAPAVAPQAEPQLSPAA
jgi:peptidoglycan/LPS O-acetylase OafA/YrhL